MTGGTPLEAVQECFRSFKNRFTGEIGVLGVGVTGSGRDYIAGCIQADVVRNEITAQVKGTTHLIPDVNTIIEIGGQDSKYIRVKNGVLIDFVMNKTCAAGTGSFLAEQADRLNVGLNRFGEMAFTAKMPLDLGARCTVFMETDCVHYQQTGHQKEDILAGLSYSIAKNYLEKVVGSRPLDGKTVIQGGIAFNKSVVAAFANLLDRELMIMPHYEVSGALGIAVLTAEEMAGGRQSQFIGFEIDDRIREKKMINCKDCSNLCNLVYITYNDGNQSIHGGICGKYERDKTAARSGWNDYFEARRKFLLSYNKSTGVGKGRIGIPQVLLFHELFPMWAVFFNTIGYDLTVSRPMSRKVYEKGIANVLVDTCFPIRCIYGAILDLIDLGADRIFLPYVLNMKDDAYPTKYAHNCQYVQQATDFIRSSLDVELLTHTVRFKDDEKQIEKAFIELAEELGEPACAAKFAYSEALKAANWFSEECKELGEQALMDLARFDKLFVLIGHPYIIHDPFYNLNLVKQLMKRGIPSIPADILPLEKGCDQVKMIDLTWKSNNRAANAINFIHHYNRTHQNQLLPVVMTQFGCAADSMLTPYLQNMLGDEPWLEIEVDEHNSGIGLMTRCEAFWESVSGKKCGDNPLDDLQTLFDTDIPLKQIKKENRKIYIFSMCEGFSAIPEVLAKYHINAEMTEKTSLYSNNLGRKYANEKHCRTYQVVIGDLLQTTEKKDFIPEKSAMFMIGYDEACRASLFKSLCPKVLRECNAGDIKMFGVTVDDPVGWIKGFGLPMALEMWTALIMLDYLDRYRFQLRPYEKEKGAVNRVYAEVKTAFFKGIRAGRAFHSFKVALNRLKQVPRVERDLVRIGVIGDAFTRVHEYGMKEIFEIVEEMGGVVMLPPSWHDFINYGAERRVGDLWRKGKYGQSLVTLVGSKSLNFFKQTIQNMAAVYSEMFDEPDNAGLTRLADKYVNVKVAPVIPSMFIGKTVDFVMGKNIHGLINSYGFNCSLGKVTTACIQRIRQASRQIPMLTFIDDGLQQTNIRTRVEAFMEQAWEYKRKIMVDEEQYIKNRIS